jgi:hypothetical protein
LHQKNHFALWRAINQTRVLQDYLLQRTSHPANRAKIMQLPAWQMHLARPALRLTDHKMGRHQLGMLEAVLLHQKSYARRPTKIMFNMHRMCMLTT